MAKKADVTESWNGKPEIGVWELVYSGNPYEKSKWPTKPSKDVNSSCNMKTFHSCLQWYVPVALTFHLFLLRKSASFGRVHVCRCLFQNLYRQTAAMKY